jgi:hypothetical protein
MYQRNEDGQAINPPVIPEYERKIYGVMEQDPGNTRKIAKLTAEYETERQNLADEEDADEKAAAEEQAAADAEARDIVRQRNAPSNSPTPPVVENFSQSAEVVK